jgi:hypothetical protein
MIYEAWKKLGIDGKYKKTNTHETDRKQRCESAGVD